MSSSWQATQVDHDALLGLNYIYVALITLWVYDYILCLPDAVTFLAESRWGLGTFLYLTCSYLPFAFMSLNMLVVFQPDVPLHLCRSYNIANTYVGIMSMLCAECRHLHNQSICSMGTGEMVCGAGDFCHCCLFSADFFQPATI
ncbi:hypothetical protein EV702DRAFT_123246 [Suillus placidus]|uniref:DUF6533 domain-containing protein n=1 Tax=Suillus placidus TaxID=48579 RepID=A0A9P6ZYK7_9AGAM|nr:hypothetical protein EV702DRAFT_123246 [Suillus placidus]